MAVSEGALQVETAVIIEHKQSFVSHSHSFRVEEITAAHTHIKPSLASNEWMASVLLTDIRLALGIWVYPTTTAGTCGRDVLMGYLHTLRTGDQMDSLLGHTLLARHLMTWFC